MDCRNIREKFSSYIDDALSPQERTSVDEHLRTCKECATSLAELKKTIEQVKSLEEVEPPAWLAQKVMAKVRAEAESRKGLFQKLFYPLSVKLPVGAIATIAIALTTLYIFRTVEPETKLAKAPREETVPQVQTREKEQQAAKPDQRDGGTDGVAPSSPPLPAPAIPLGKMRSEDRVLPKTPEPTKQVEVPQEQTSPAPIKRKDAAAPSASSPVKEEIKREAAPPAPASRGTAVEKAEPYRVIVQVSDVAAARNEIERTISKLGGRIIRREVTEDKDILTAELDTSRLNELFERLRAVGEVIGEGVEFPQNVIQIRIEIIKK